jgi:peptidyl-prolyl cis-trans isomerase D
VQKSWSRQEARSLGLLATDDDIANQLAKVPEFKSPVALTKNATCKFCRPTACNRHRRRPAQPDHLAAALQHHTGLVQVSDAEVRERYRLDQEKINLQYVKSSVGDFASQVKLTDEDVKKFYDRNKDSLKEPLKIQFEYLTYPFEQFSAKAQVSVKEIEDYYQNNQKTKFHRPREAKVRYIALAVAPTANAEEKKAAAAAEAIVKEARQGKTSPACQKQSLT